MGSSHPRSAGALGMLPSAPGPVCPSVCLFSLLPLPGSPLRAEVSPLLQFLFFLFASCTPSPPPPPFTPPPPPPPTPSSNTLQPRYSNSGPPRINSVGATREPARNADSQAPPQTCWIRTCISARPPGDLCVLF